MKKISRKNISRKNVSKNNKKSMKNGKKNVKHYSKKNNFHKMRGGDDEFNEELLKRIRENDSSLISVDISNQNIGDKGAFSLARGLTENKTLKKLNISDNNISKKGAEDIFNALRGPKKSKEYSFLPNLTLIELIFKNNKFGDFENMIYVLIERNKYYQDIIVNNPDLDDIKEISDMIYKEFEKNHPLVKNHQLIVLNNLFKKEDYFLD